VDVQRPDAGRDRRSAGPASLTSDVASSSQTSEWMHRRPDPYGFGRPGREQPGTCPTQAEAMPAPDFTETITLTSTRMYVLAVIEHASPPHLDPRRNHTPDRGAGNPGSPEPGHGLQDVASNVRYLIRHRNEKYPAPFDQTLADTGITVVRSSAEHVPPELDVQALPLSLHSHHPSGGTVLPRPSDHSLFGRRLLHIADGPRPFRLCRAARRPTPW